MSLITWDDSFSVKISEIDTQHKKLVDLINQLHDAMKQRKANDALADVLNELVDYTVQHFKLEEKYFDEFNYLKAGPHKREHKNFVEKVAAFKNDFDNGKMMLSMDIMDFLKDWLTVHIKKTDIDYSDFFIEKGLS